MIYLVGSYHAARMWGIDEDVDTNPRAGVVKVITTLEYAHGLRPLLSDRIVLLRDGDVEAHLYLEHALELSKGRRDISVRQAP